MAVEINSQEWSSQPECSTVEDHRANQNAAGRISAAFDWLVGQSKRKHVTVEDNRDRTWHREVNRSRNSLSRGRLAIQSNLELFPTSAHMARIDGREGIERFDRDAKMALWHTNRS
jgi:hypothetical protein